MVDYESLSLPEPTSAATTFRSDDQHLHISKAFAVVALAGTNGLACQLFVYLDDTMPTDGATESLLRFKLVAWPSWSTAIGVGLVITTPSTIIHSEYWHSAWRVLTLGWNGSHTNFMLALQCFIPVAEFKALGCSAQ